MSDSEESLIHFSVRKAYAKAGSKRPTGVTLPEGIYPQWDTETPSRRPAAAAGREVGPPDYKS